MDMGISQDFCKTKNYRKQCLAKMNPNLSQNMILSEQKAIKKALKFASSTENLPSTNINVNNLYKF